MSGDFPERINYLEVGDLFENYNLLFEDETRTVYVDCETCDDIVGTMTYDEVQDKSDLDIYELIIDRHRPI